MTSGSIFLASIMTGVFCAAFALIVDTVTDALSMKAVIGVAFASGFCGSLFAQFVLRGRK